VHTTQGPFQETLLRRNNIKGIRVTAKSGADKKIFRDIVDVTMGALG
jgi:hypothetical protein